MSEEMREKQKIAIITPSFNGGGAERIAVNLANYYAEQYEVEIIAFKGTGPYLSQVSNNVKVTVLNSRARYVFFKLLKALKSSQPDIVLSVIRDANIFVGLTSFFINAKIIYREANTMNVVFAMPVIKQAIYKRLMRLAYSKADKVIANSDDTKKDLIANKVVADTQCQVIGNPVLPPNVENLMLEKVTHEWFEDKVIKTIINVGRLHKQKNQALLLKAFAKALKQDNRLRLIILGEGEEYESLMSLAQNLGIKEYMQIIKFQANPYPYYKNADVFALSSSWEGFGNVIVEAMACKTPVVCADCAGGPKMILNSGEFGDLVSVDDVEKLAEAIVGNIANLDNDRIIKAKKRAFEFSVPSVAKKYLD